MPNKTARTLAQVFGGILAAQTGVMAGEQQARARDLQEQELKRRRQEDEQQQLLRLFSMGAQIEERERAARRAPYDQAIDLSDKDADLSGLLRAREDFIASEPPSQYGVEQFRMITGGGGAGAQGRYAGPQQPLPPSGGEPRPVATTPQPIRTDPSLKDAYQVPIAMREKRLAEGVEDAAEAQGLQDDLVALRKGLRAGIPVERVVVANAAGVAQPVRPSLPPTKASAGDQGLIRTQLTDTRKRLSDYIALGGPPEEREARAAEVTPFLQQLAGLKVTSRDDLDSARSFFASAPLINLANRVDRRQAEWQQTQTAKTDETKRVEGARAAAGEWKRIDSRLTAAQTSKSPKLLAEAISRQLDFLDKHPEFEGEAFEGGRIDPRPQAVTRTVPKLPWTGAVAEGAVAEGPGGDVEMVAVEETETPAEASARVTDELAEYFIKVDPAEGLKLKREAIGRLWAVARDPKASEGARNDALRRIAAISAGYPELEGTYPTSLKLEPYTPWQRREIQRDVILDKERQEDRARKKEAHAAAMQQKRVDFDKKKQDLQQGRSKLTGSNQLAAGVATKKFEAAMKEQAELAAMPLTLRARLNYDSRKLAADKAMAEANDDLTQGLTSGDFVSQMIPSRRGPRDQWGFTKHDQETIQSLIRRGAAPARAAEIVRKSNLRTENGAR